MVKKSARDVLFEGTMNDLLDYLAIPAEGGKGEGPMFKVENNKKFSRLNGRTFLAGVSPHLNDPNRQHGIGIVEMLPNLQVLPHVVIHISPNIQDPSVLGLDRCDPRADLSVAEYMELFQFLHYFLASWKMDKSYSKHGGFSKSVN